MLRTSINICTVTDVMTTFLVFGGPDGVRAADASEANLA